MNLGFVTNLRSPYRTLQLNEFSKIEDLNITAYYCQNNKDNRNWGKLDSIKYREIDLIGKRIFKKYGYINKGLFDIVKNNDVIIIGGYQQPTYILLSLICRLYRKKYILLYDGLSRERLYIKEKKYKFILKKTVIKNAAYILGNGKVSKEYFSKKFKYPTKKIYNQYLSIDVKKIDEIYKLKKTYRDTYRKKLGIKESDKVILFSGRTVKEKNIEKVIMALSILKNDNIIFVITGGGELEENLKKMAKNLNVKLIITGFISNQQELFKHYCLADALILPSIYEPWGLVVNEAMRLGLPVIVSKACGCSLDLVKEGENGYTINPIDINDISEKINLVLFKLEKNNSREIIGEWVVENSRKSLEEILHLI